VSVFRPDASLGLALLYVMQTHPDIAKSLVTLTQRVKASSDRLMSAGRAGELTVSLSDMCALVHKQIHRRTHTNIETTAHNSTYIILLKSVIMMFRVCFVNICAHACVCVSLGVTIQSIVGAIDRFRNGNKGRFRVGNVAERSHRNVAGPDRPVSNWIKC
jgi:hypothetical protein